MIICKSESNLEVQIKRETYTLPQYTVLSISFEVNGCTRQVCGSLLFERRRREPPRGVWGHAPQKILKFRCVESEKMCSAMSASVSLARTPFWHMQKPGV